MSLEQQFEFQNKVEVLVHKTKGNKIFRNVWIRWINIFNSAIKVVNDYKAIVVKNGIANKLWIKSSLINSWSFFLMWSFCWALLCITFVETYMHLLRKFVQLQEIFVWDFIFIVKIWQINLHGNLKVHKSWYCLHKYCI
jgi:hypothetical protein